LVVINGDIFIGLISFKSVINALQAGETEYPAVELIQEDVITLHPETLLIKLIDNSPPKHHSLYPVIREDKLLGVVTEKDLNNLLLERQALLNQQD
jgi:predicted transcriptional regulator